MNKLCPKASKFLLSGILINLIGAAAVTILTTIGAISIRLGAPYDQMAAVVMGLAFALCIAAAFIYAVKTFFHMLFLVFVIKHKHKPASGG